jgi:hypothetical protein
MVDTMLLFATWLMGFGVGIIMTLIIWRIVDSTKRK